VHRDLFFVAAKTDPTAKAYARLQPVALLTYGDSLLQPGKTVHDYLKESLVQRPRLHDKSVSPH
jgi:hypothetical protein